MWRRIKLYVKRTALTIGALLLLFANYLALAPQGQDIMASALFVVQTLPIPVKPQEWFTPDPIREEVTYPLASGKGTADIYRTPGDDARPGVVVFLGVNPAPRDDARVVNLGEGLARAGFAVMIPWSPSMMQDRVDPREPDNLVRAFQFLAEQDYVDSEKVGLGGFCVGASLSVVAASDQRISERVNFVSAFGGYYDIRDLLAQIAANRSFYNSEVGPWDPRSATDRVFVNQIIEGLPSPDEREALDRIFVRREPDASLPETLSPEAQAAYALLRSATASDDDEHLSVEEAQAQIELLPSGLLQDLDRISPSSAVAGLQAKLLIAHDREDDAVPSEESRRLGDAVEGQIELHRTEFSFFSHVTPDKPVGPFTFVKEAFKLFKYTYNLISVV